MTSPMSDQPRLRVLIVEDDCTSRLVLRGILEALDGLEIFEAEDGLQAWQMLDGWLLPQLCFLDLNMPQLNGVELLKRIRNDERFAALKVCFCSGVRDRRAIAQAAALQPDIYILKPYERSAIEEQVLKAKASRLPEEPLESTEEICARLGIDPEVYDFQMNALMEDSHALTTRLPFLLTQLDLAGALSELDRIRFSAQALGARGIFKIADALRCSLASDAALTDQRILRVMSELRGELQAVVRLTEDARRMQDSR
jgi:two-component system chemotaxis response regulator CheY